MAVTRAIILAAGEGSRMRPLTYTRPKVMLPLANRPILEHLLIEMRAAGIREFTFVVGYHDEQIRGYFGDGTRWGVNIGYSSQTHQLGTADALRTLKGFIRDNFLVANGDVIIDHADIGHVVNGADTVIGAIELSDVSGLGVLEVYNGRVMRIVEKSASPPSHLANAGLYLFTPAIFEAIDRTSKSPRGEYEITDSIQNLINGGYTVEYYRLNRWWDLSYPWDLLSANESILTGLSSETLGEVEPGAVIKGAVSIGRRTIVRSGAYILGPVIIGEGGDIGPNCFIRSSTAIGNGCHIGAGVELKNSIVMNGTKIPHLNYVGDSVIGENCNLGAGTKIANLKLTKGNIRVNEVDTHRRKLGAIIGDNVQTGINSSINVGTLIGNDSLVGPGALAHGVILPGSKIF